MTRVTNGYIFSIALNCSPLHQFLHFQQHQQQQGSFVMKDAAPRTQISTLLLVLCRMQWSAVHTMHAASVVAPRVYCTKCTKGTTVISPIPSDVTGPRGYHIYLSTSRGVLREVYHGCILHDAQRVSRTKSTKDVHQGTPRLYCTGVLWVQRECTE